MPTSVNNYKTPIQVMSSHVNIPSLLNLYPRVFGCTVFVHVQKTNRTKLEANVEKCVFLDFCQFKKGYKVLILLRGNSTLLWMLLFLKMIFFFDKNQFSSQEEIDENDQKLSFLSENYFDQIRINHIRIDTSKRGAHNESDHTESQPIREEGLNNSNMDQNKNEIMNSPGPFRKEVHNNSHMHSPGANENLNSSDQNIDEPPANDMKIRNNQNA
jgi:hypothetical protein